MAAQRTDGPAGREQWEREEVPKATTLFTAPGQYFGHLRAGVRRRLGDPSSRAGTIALLVLAGLVIVGFAYFASLMIRTPSVEGLEESRYSQATVVYSEDGEQLARFYRENRTWVPLDSIAPAVVHALIDTEDRRFYQHWGIDVRRTFGAVARTLAGSRQGGSTITMQLVRNAYPSVADDRALTRKFKEWLTALQLEQNYTKDEILEIYLNTVPFNYNAFGIEAAARTYFNRPAIRLDTVQAATLVGMLKGTALYNPVKNPDASKERRNVVLAQMAEAGTITPAEQERLSRRGLELDFSPITSNQNRAPYFAEHVRQWLGDWAEENDVDIYSDGLRVYTTIDARLQAAAEKAVAQELAELQAVVDVAWSQASMPLVSSNPAAYQRLRDQVKPFAYFWEANPDVLPALIERTQKYRQMVDDGTAEDEALRQLRADAAFVDSVKTSMTQLEAGFVAIDPQTGHVKAWVGGRGFEESKYDHVTQSKRQPGSTFKPFVYAAALQKGYRPNDYLRDARIEYVAPRTRKEWSPGNFDAESGEFMPLRQGLAQSKNTITSQLIVDVGPQKVVDLAHQLGIESELDAVPSLGLGTSVVSLLEMVTAYATIADNGTYHKPLSVSRIENGQGEVLATFETESREAVDPTLAYGVLDMMRGVVDDGTGVRIRSQYGAQGDLAGKTGTTQRAADGWFMLMHPKLVMGAWVGFPTPAVTFRSRFWGQGSHNALHVVGSFYRDVGLPTDARFTAPPGYAPPSGPGRYLLVQNNGSSDLHLAASGTPAGDRLRDGETERAPAEDLFSRFRDDRDEDLPDADDLRRTPRPGEADDGRGRSFNSSADAARDRDRDETVQDRARGADDAGRERDASESQAEERTPPSSETERLNRQERENSKVDEYLERLGERNGRGGDNRP